MQASAQKILQLFPQVRGYTRSRAVVTGSSKPAETPDHERTAEGLRGGERTSLRPLKLPYPLACLGLLSLLGTRLEADHIPLQASTVRALVPLEAPAQPRALIAAHRGGSGLQVENSLEAFHAAVTAGAEQLELDVHQTLDGHLVVMHDPTLERTSMGEGPIRTKTLAELERIHLRAPDGSSAGKIPALEDVLQAFPTTALLLELKVDEQHAAYPDIEARLAALLHTQGATGRVRVIAFELESLARMRAADSTVALGQLVPAAYYETTPRMQHLASLQALKIDWLGMAGEGIEPGLARMLRQAGIALAAWTINDRDTAARLSALVDVLITDDIQGCREVLRRS